MKKKHCFSTHMLYITTSLLMVGCEHKELCYDHPHTTQLQVVFDWAKAPDASPKRTTFEVTTRTTALLSRLSSLGVPSQNAPRAEGTKNERNPCRSTCFRRMAARRCVTSSQVIKAAKSGYRQDTMTHCA